MVVIVTERFSRVYDHAVGVTDISWWGLGLAFLLVAIAMAVSYWQGLGLGRNLLIGSLRTTVQLLIMGFVIGWIIKADNFWLVAAAMAFQLAIAAWTAAGLQHPPLPGSRLIALAALAPTYIAVSFVLYFVVIQQQPWWDPRIVLPLGGMLLGNSLTGTALALNRYRGGVRDNRELIMVRLSLGATWRQAVDEERREAARAALMPTTAAMLTVGLVALPGMMTGQIIAGANPVIAVKYQIVVMFMLAAATALATTIALNMVLRRARFENA